MRHEWLKNTTYGACVYTVQRIGHIFATILYQLNNSVCFRTKEENMKRQQNIGYILLCLLLCNSVVTTYSSIEHNAKTYGKAKFLKKVQDTLVKLNEPQRMQANANAKILHRNQGEHHCVFPCLRAHGPEGTCRYLLQ